MMSSFVNKIYMNRKATCTVTYQTTLIWWAHNENLLKDYLGRMKSDCLIVHKSYTGYIPNSRRLVPLCYVDREECKGAVKCQSEDGLIATTGLNLNPANLHRDSTLRHFAWQERRIQGAVNRRMDCDNCGQVNTGLNLNPPNLHRNPTLRHFS